MINSRMNDKNLRKLLHHSTYCAYFFRELRYKDKLGHIYFLKKSPCKEIRHILIPVLYIPHPAVRIFKILISMSIIGGCIW